MKSFCIHLLIDGLENSGKTPVERLAHVFDMVGRIPAGAILADGQDELLQYLTKLARSSHIRQPEAFAQQILIMAVDARKKQLAEPDSQAIKHAQIAASALITAQTRNRFSRNSHIYAMAASFFLFFGVSSMILTPKAAKERQVVSVADTLDPQLLQGRYNPKRLSEMISHREQMRHGTCVFPEALMLAEADRSIYLKNVVYGDITNDIKEQEVASRLMQSVRCNYSPMLMKNSVS